MKPNLQKKAVASALIGLGLAAASPADAVYVSPNGVGQVLLFPYYTVRSRGASPADAYNTLFSIVNTADKAKVVNVSVYAATPNSLSPSPLVLNFHVYLSRFDTWTAAIVDSVSGPRLGSADQSCTVVASNQTTATQGVEAIGRGGVALPYFLASGTVTPDAAREGYIQVVEMGVLPSSAPNLEQLATHVQGVPGNCAALMFNEASNAPFILSPTGGLMGSFTLLNVNDGTSYGGNAVALGAFYTAVGSNIFSAVSSSISPDLRAAFPPVSTNTFEDTNGVVTTLSADWTGGAVGNGAADAVSAALLSNSIMNEFMLDPVIDGGTDWVVTLPTRSLYSGTPFNSNFTTCGPRSCSDLVLNVYDREERVPALGTGTTQATIVSLCNSTHVITFNGSNVLASANAINLTVPFDNGWMRMRFGSLRLPTPRLTFEANAFGGVSFRNAATYVGLPVIGFAVQRAVNGSLIVGGATGVLANYGTTFPHRYEPGATAPPPPSGTQ